MIRKADCSDFDAILDLSEEFWESTIYIEKFDRDHTRAMVEIAYECGLLAVIDLDGVVGFCAAVKAPILGSPLALGATELAWYVKPAYRGGRKGIELMKFMEQLASEEGVKYFTMVAMNSSMEVGSIYERLGYKKSETSYTKVL
jgi:N-acetylglutamate synthase-like GNAT family acetyltransferase